MAPYRNRTNFYRIPVMAEGDQMTEQQEWVQMSTIDNLLFAATFGCGKAFLEEGRYSLKWNNNRTECRLVVAPMKAEGFSLMGLINYRMFFSRKEQEVGVLYSNAKYYVYVEYQEGLETDPECFALRAYTSGQKEDVNRMALCIVDTTDGTIDTDVNKVYAKNILAHTTDSTNPHGKALSQEELNVTGSLTVGGRPVLGVEYRDFLSGGQQALTFSFDGEPVFAEIYAESPSAGTFCWKINGNTLSVSNSGDAGIPVHARIEVR